MDHVAELTGGKESFFKHMTRFNEDTKAELSNMCQYLLIAYLPILGLNKLVQTYVPEADDRKNSLEIMAEILLQVIVMFLGMYIIQRFITYFPTYSGEKYSNFHIENIIMVTLFIILSIQSKLGEKTNILMERCYEAMFNSSSKKKKTKGGNNTLGVPSNSMVNDTTPISSLPSIQPVQQQVQQQSNPNYNNMYQSNPTPLVDASEPMPANAMGSAFGSW